MGMSKYLDRMLIALAIIMSIALALVDPSACIMLVGLGLLCFVLVVGGLALLIWLWGWRRPGLHRRLKRLVQAVRVAASTRAKVLSVDLSRTPSSLANQMVVVVVESDADRAELLDPTFGSTFRQLLVENCLPYPGQTRIGLTVDSQETVDRDYGGNWALYDR